MASRDRAITSLLRELSRRKVTQVIIAYGAFAWLLLQVGDLAFDTFGSPAWSMRVLFVVLLLGLPVTVILAWVFELGPGGIDRTQPLATQAPSSTGVPVTLSAVIAGDDAEGGISPRQANLLLREFSLWAVEFRSTATKVEANELEVEFQEALDALQFSVRVLGHSQQLEVPLCIGIASLPGNLRDDSPGMGGAGLARRLSRQAGSGTVLIDKPVGKAFEKTRDPVLRRALKPGPAAVGKETDGLYVIGREQIGELDEELKKWLGGAPADEPSTLLKVLSLAFLTALVGLLWSWLPSLQQSVDEPPPTLAILPFTDLADDAGSRLLIEGLNEDLFNTMARIDRIRIAARRSSRMLRGTDKSVQEIGQLLNAMLLLEGEIRPIDGRLKVTAWLTDTATGLERWSRSFEQPEGRLDQIREQLTVELAEELDLTVDPQVFMVQKEVTRRDPDVYPMYLQALGYLKQPMTEESLSNAQERFERVIEMAPDYLAAKAGLCRTHLSWYINFRDTEHFETAQSYCQQQLDAQAENVDLLLALGDLHRIRGDNAAAREFYERGLALNAGNIDIHVGLAQLLIAENNKEAAERMLRQALTMDPAYYKLHAELGTLYLLSGRWEESIAAYSRAVELNPKDYGTQSNLGSAYFYAGRFAEAAAAYERSLELEPNRTALSNTATMYFYNGDFGRAAELYIQAAEQAPKDYRLWVNLADTESQIDGAEAEAREHYQKAFNLMMENLQVNERDAEVLALAAWCAVNLGDAATAELRITEAILQDGENPVILYYAAQVNDALGKREVAASFVLRALENGFPGNVMAATPGLSELTPDH